MRKTQKYGYFAEEIALRTEHTVGVKSNHTLKKIITYIHT